MNNPVIFSKGEQKKLPLTDFTQDFEIVDRFVIHPLLSDSKPVDGYWTITHQPSGWAIATFDSVEVVKQAVGDFLKMQGWNRAINKMADDAYFMYLMIKTIQKYGGWWYDENGNVCT